MVTVKTFFESKDNPLPADWPGLKPVWNQVHGIKNVEVIAPGQECGDADMLWTRKAGQPVGVRAADCVPILLEYRKGKQTDVNTHAVGAIHAGWRGTFAHIIEHFFNSMPREFSDAEHWRVIMGPSIRACCYEVAPDLIEKFTNEFSYIPRGIIEPSDRRLDLIAVNLAELKRLGVTAIEVHPDCTFCSEKYYSYRRGDRNTRQHSIISF